jgi:hypothetical protein
VSVQARLGYFGGGARCRRFGDPPRVSSIMLSFRVTLAYFPLRAPPAKSFPAWKISRSTVSCAGGCSADTGFFLRAGARHPSGAPSALCGQFPTSGFGYEEVCLALAVCLSDMGGSSLRYAGKAGPLRFLSATKRPSGEAFAPHKSPGPGVYSSRRSSADPGRARPTEAALGKLQFATSLPASTHVQTTSQAQHAGDLFSA